MKMLTYANNGGWGAMADGGSEISMSKAIATAASEVKRAGERKDLLGPNSEIGRKLKQYYESLVAETVPDRFQELLQQLEDQEKPDIPPPGGQQGK